MRAIVPRRTPQSEPMTRLASALKAMAVGHNAGLQHETGTHNKAIPRFLIVEFPAISVKSGQSHRHCFPAL